MLFSMYFVAKKFIILVQVFFLKIDDDAQVAIVHK